MILVTGALGFIGSHTVRALLDAGQHVLAARNRNSVIPRYLTADLGKSLFIESLDVRSGAAVKRLCAQYSVASILHLAAPALGALDGAEEFELNMQGLLHILEAAREQKMRRVSLASSVAVYVGLPSGPFREDQPLRLAASSSTEAYKKTYEILGQHIGAQFGVEVLSLRIGHIYGPGYRSLANVPSRIVHAVARGVPGPLARAGAAEPFAEDGGDFCYVKDCAHGIGLLHLADRLSARTYNIGSGRMSRLADFACAAQTVRPDAVINLSQGRGPTHVEHAVMDISRARADVGYAPSYGPGEGVSDYLAWLASDQER